MTATITLDDAREILSAHFEEAPMSDISSDALNTIVDSNESLDFHRGLLYGMMLAHESLNHVDAMADVYKAMESFRQVGARAANHIVD